MKTARFAEVVKQCGEPEPHLILIEPRKDRELQAAIKAKRVMTVFQDAVGSKADRGVVGFEAGPERQFLVFPKALRGFEGKQIVGIKYELWSTKEPSKAERAPVKTPEKKPKRAAKLPANVFMFPTMRGAEEEGSAKRRDGDDGEAVAAPEAGKTRAQARARSAAQSTKSRTAKTKLKGKGPRATKDSREAAEKAKASAPGREIQARREDHETRAEIAEMKKQVRAAMDALEQGKQIAAFNILKRIAED